jgi:predicted secreted protein
MTTAVHGHGTTLLIGDSTEFSTSTAIGQIVSLNGAGYTKDVIDVSNMGSANKWREFILGMVDFGELSGDIVYDGSTNAAAMAAQITQVARWWRVTFPDGTNAASSSHIIVKGFLTSLGHVISYDDKVGQSFTVKLTEQGWFWPKT